MVAFHRNTLRFQPSWCIAARTWILSDAWWVNESLGASELACWGSEMSARNGALSLFWLVDKRQLRNASYKKLRRSQGTENGVIYQCIKVQGCFHKFRRHGPLGVACIYFLGGSKHFHFHKFCSLLSGYTHFKWSLTAEHILTEMV